MFALVDWIYLGAYLGKKMMCNLQVHPEGAGGRVPIFAYRYGDCVKIALRLWSL